MLNTIKLVRENLNPSLQIEGVILTMADFRTNLTKEVIDETRNYFKEKVYKTVIPRNIRLTEAPSFGKPIAIYDRSSIGATRYESLSCEIMGIDFKESDIQQHEHVMAEADLAPSENLGRTNILTKAEGINQPQTS